MTPERLAELRRLAEAAHVGPWCWDYISDKGNGYIVGYAETENGVALSGCVSDDHEDDGTYIERFGECSIVLQHEAATVDYKTAQYIAATDPTTVLQLLDHIDELEKQIIAMDAAKGRE